MADFRKAEIMNCAMTALEKLDDIVVGCDENEREIENLVVDFLSSQKGQCCLLEGEPNCGRETVLMKVLNKYKLELRIINVGYAAADPLLQESLAREVDENYNIFLIRDSDELLTAHQQEFLYTLTDRATVCSWLVFFSVTRHSFAQNLEKRGNSRMPRIRVTFDNALSFEEYCSAFREMIIPKCSEVVTSTNYDYFFREMKCETWLREFYELYNFDGLKQLAAIILMNIGTLYDKVDIENIIKNSISSLVGESRKVSILQDQTLRSKCVFLCAHRLVKNKKAESDLTTARTTYRTVFLEYKKLANIHYAPLNVNNDVFVFREIDHLVEIGLLKADKNSNITNTSFRKIWLDLDSLTVEKSITDLKLPTTVRDFFATIMN